MMTCRCGQRLPRPASLSTWTGGTSLYGIAVVGHASPATQAEGVTFELSHCERKSAKWRIRNPMASH
eukprot:755045-Amphidinium_carterae.1